MQDAQHAWSVVSKYYCICIVFDYFVSRIPCISISMVPLKLRALFIVSFSLLSCLEELSSTQLFINLKYTHCAIRASGKRAVFRHILLLFTMAHSDWDYFKTPLNHNVRNSSSPGPCSGHIRAPAANKHSPSPSALQSVISCECEVELETKIHKRPVTNQPAVVCSDGAGVDAGDGAIVGQPPANQRPQLQCWQVSALLAHAALQLGQGWPLLSQLSSARVF